jgi:hypothetical protein
VSLSYTDVEKTTIELQRATIVQATGSAFQTAMQHKFIAAVERLLELDLQGRAVLPRHRSVRRTG